VAAAVYERALRVRLLPVWSLFLLIDGPTIMPVAAVDMRGRPDVRDLFRAHQRTGEGHAETFWNIGWSGARLERMTVYLEIQAIRRSPARLSWRFPTHPSTRRGWMPAPPTAMCT